MASATGIPDRNPDVDNGAGESEPLLGRPGDVMQKPDEPIYHNLISGKPLSSPSLSPGKRNLRLCVLN